MATKISWLEVCGCEIDGVNGIFKAIKGQDAYAKAGTNYIINKSGPFWYIRDKDIIIMRSRLPNDHLVGMEWFRPELSSATKTKRPVMDGKRPLQSASQRDAMHKEASAADPPEQSVFRSMSSAVDLCDRCEQMRRDLINIHEHADTKEKQLRATEETYKTMLSNAIKERDAALADIRSLKSQLEQLQTTGKRASELAQREMQELHEQRKRQLSALQSQNADMEKRSSQFYLQALDAQRALRDVKAQLALEEKKSAELSAQLTSANADLRKLRIACKSETGFEAQKHQLMQQLENALSSCETFRLAAEDAQRKLAAAEKVLRDTQKQRDDANMQATDYFKQSEGFYLTLTNTMAERDQALSRLAERSRECEELRAQAERLQQQVTALSTSTIASTDHESIVATWREKLRVATGDINVLTNALREAQEELSAAVTASAQDRAQHERALQALQGELAAATDRDDMTNAISAADHESIVATWRENLRVATAEINVLTGALREAQDELSAAVTASTQDRAKHESALQALQGELAAAKRDRDDIQAQLQSMADAISAADHESIVATWRDKLRGANADISVLTGALREAQEELSVAATTCEQDRAKHERALQMVQGELAAAKRDRDEIQAQLQSTVAACDAANAKSSVLQQCLDVMQGQLRTATTSSATTAVAANKSLATQQEQHQGSPSAMQDSSSTSLKAQLEEERKQHMQELRESQDKMQELIEARDKAKQHAEALLKRSGQNHIKRDWERLKGGGHFPAGADLREAFTAAFLNFESFACDAIYALENLGHSETVAADVFVAQVMSPLYAGCKGYVDAQLQRYRELMLTEFGMEVPTDLTNDTVPKLFWFKSMQERLPREIKALTDEQINELMVRVDCEQNGMILAVHARMLEDSESGAISSSDSDLRLPQLARTLLLLFIHAALSDPNCFLLPEPGTSLSYHNERCKEILSPGAKNHGLIKEGAKVQVVLPGLYFDDGTGTGVMSLVVPSLVRRTVSTGAAVTAPKTGTAPMKASGAAPAPPPPPLTEVASPASSREAGPFTHPSAAGAGDPSLWPRTAVPAAQWDEAVLPPPLLHTKNKGYEDLD